MNLEKVIKDYIFALPHAKTGVPHGWKYSWGEEEVTKIAKHFFELGLKIKRFPNNRKNDCRGIIKVQNRRGKHQFELATIIRKNLLDEYKWCLSHLPLKEDKGIVYQVREVFIITSSQKILDKVNRHFGVDFSFDNFSEHNRYYI